MRARWVFCAVLSSMARADILDEIQQRMEENLERVPDYTCEQTIERAARPNAKQPFRTMDRLRFEVALVEGKEMYSWPGEARFSERTPGEIVPGGTTTTGDYALHARTIFVSQAAEFSGGVEEDLEGQRAVRYDFRVPRKMSNYRVQAGEHGAIVAYRGSFWAQAGTLELLRLRIEVDEPPAALGVKRAITVIDYGKVPVGMSEFLLPQRVEFTLARANGGESRNRAEFRRCRQYVGETQISFEEPGEARSATEKEAPVVTLPAGLAVETRLVEPIDSEQAATGDLVTARVTSAVKREGKIVVPKGAILQGRLRRLERAMSPRTYYFLELEFSELEWAEGRTKWQAELETAGPWIGGPRGGLVTPREQPPGRAVLLVGGNRVRLPPGFRLLWVTAGH